MIETLFACVEATNARDWNSKIIPDFQQALIILMLIANN